MVTFTGDVQALFSHPAHHHGLKLVVDADKLFQCDGCRQLGNQLRYRCEQCDFDLHASCAHAPALKEHPMFEGRVFALLDRSTYASGFGLCDVCYDPLHGFHYHNSEHKIDLHPSCAILPERIVVGGRVLELQKADGHNCGLCGKTGLRSRGWAYRFQDDDGELVHLHVACMMEAQYSTDDDVVQGSSTATGEVSDRRLVNAPTTGSLAMVQYAPSRRRSKFKLFCKVAFRVAMFSHSVATLNPMGVVASFT
ncbi:unnamed protein product [Alopecurus aequalis]